MINFLAVIVVPLKKSIIIMMKILRILFNIKILKNTKNKDFQNHKINNNFKCNNKSCNNQIIFNLINKIVKFLSIIFSKTITFNHIK